LRVESSENEAVTSVAKVNETRTNVNTKITSFGRPVNSSAQQRWKAPTLSQSNIEVVSEPRSEERENPDIYRFLNEELYDDSKLNFPDSNMSEISKPKGPSFKITGNSMLGNKSIDSGFMNQGRPIPTVQVVENPVC